MIHPEVHHEKSIVSVSAGEYVTVGVKADGTVVATPYERYKYMDNGEGDVAGWKLI